MLATKIIEVQETKEEKKESCLPGMATFNSLVSTLLTLSCVDCTSPIPS